MSLAWHRQGKRSEQENIDVTFHLINKNNRLNSSTQNYCNLLKIKTGI